MTTLLGTSAPSPAVDRVADALRVAMSASLRKYVSSRQATFDTHHRLKMLSVTFHGAPRNRWVWLDDLEFNLPLALTGDELAQCIFILSGGSPTDPENSRGETANYYLHYAIDRPASLLLECKGELAGAPLVSARR